MPAPNWHEATRKALTRRRLPPRQVRRLMDELHDHYLNLMEENPNMNSDSLADRLGDPDDLAEYALAEHRRRSFAGRHPVVMFLVAPIPLALAVVVAAVALLVGVASLIPEQIAHGETGVAATSILMAFVSWGLRLFPFALLAAVFSRMARTSLCDWRWGFAASMLVALLAGAFAVDYQLPTALPNSGRFSVGLGFPGGPIQALQFAVPVAVATLLAFYPGGANSAHALAFPASDGVDSSDRAA